MKYLLIVSAFISQFAFATIRTDQEEELSKRIKEAAARVLERYPDLTDLSFIVSNPRAIPTRAILHSKIRPQAQLLVFDELSIQDCVLLLKLKIEPLKFISGEITSNTSESVAGNIADVAMVYERVIDRINDNSEWGPIAVQAKEALRNFRRIAKLPVTRYVLATDAQVREGKEQGRALTTAAAILGSPGLFIAGVTREILSGPVHVSLPDPERAAAISKAAAEGEKRITERLRIVSSDLEMSALGRGLARLRTHCQNALTFSR